MTVPMFLDSYVKGPTFLTYQLPAINEYKKIKGQSINWSTFRMIKHKNGSLFSNARCMNGVGFEILARTPVPKLPTSFPPTHPPPPPPPPRAAASILTLSIALDKERFFLFFFCCFFFFVFFVVVFFFFFSTKKCPYFSYFSTKKCCGYSLEARRRGASNEYPQHIFSLRNKKSIYLILTPL